jgi:16S rRNA (guanine527-N7)-methyltransferase
MNMKKRMAGLLAYWEMEADETALERFEEYANLLRERGSRMNLIADTDPEEIAVRHFMDSLVLLRLGLKIGSSAVDVGSGAGFPGVPLKIMRPDIGMTLLESVGKKAWFLREVKERLSLDGLEIVNARAEEAAHLKERRERYDYVLGRAVARMNILAELCIPFSVVGGEFLAMKSLRAADEIADARKAVRVLGGEFTGKFEYTLPDRDMNLAVFRIGKVAPTPAGYPRRFAKIKQKPL